MRFLSPHEFASEITSSGSQSPKLEGITARNPRRAALLSIIPGLGQLYNGEVGKAVLFLSIWLINLMFFLAIAFPGAAAVLIEGLSGVFHLTPNWKAIAVLTEAQSSGPVPVIYVGLLLGFVIYASCDAYNHALLSLRGVAFPRFVLSLPETWSGSYLGHVLLTVACLIACLFLSLPKPPVEQITDIELVPPPPMPQKERPSKPKPESKPEPKNTRPKAVVKPQAPKPTPVAVVSTNPTAIPDTVTPASQPEPAAPAPTVAASPSGADGGAGSSGTAKEVDFGGYLSDLQRRIKKAWFPPRGDESKRVMVRFKVRRRGDISRVKLERSSGLSIADEAAISAVENAAPFPPLPDGAPEEIEIKFSFDYDVFNGSGRRQASGPGTIAGGSDLTAN